MATLLFRITRRSAQAPLSLQFSPSPHPSSNLAQSTSLRCVLSVKYFGSRVSPSFDTHELVKRLVNSGFTYEQAEVVLESMKQAAEQYASTADSIYPTKIEMIEKNLAYKADFAGMKSELVLMLKQDVALLKNEVHKVCSPSTLAGAMGFDSVFPFRGSA
jgi:hypothetical protein